MVTECDRVRVPAAPACYGLLLVLLVVFAGGCSTPQPPAQTAAPTAPPAPTSAPAATPAPTPTPDPTNDDHAAIRHYQTERNQALTDRRLLDFLTEHSAHELTPPQVLAYHTDLYNTANPCGTDTDCDFRRTLKPWHRLAEQGDQQLAETYTDPAPDPDADPTNGGRVYLTETVTAAGGTYTARLEVADSRVVWHGQP